VQNEGALNMTAELRTGGSCDTERDRSVSSWQVLNVTVVLRTGGSCGVERDRSASNLWQLQYVQFAATHLPRGT